MIFEVETSDAPELVHYGVKGMRWGERRARRKAMKAKDKASLAKDKAAYNRSIDQARARVASGQTSRSYATAKAKYKRDKFIIGKREAKKALNLARQKRANDYELAEKVKTGREATTAMLGLIGIASVAGIVQAAQILSAA